MAKKFFQKRISTNALGMRIDEITTLYATQRHKFERRWYDNNFFDDGFHFRYVSRTTGKILDQSESSSLGMPQRSIPKASRQIRGVANLLLGPEYLPVIYPEAISKINYQDPLMYAAAEELAKEIAKKTGHFIQEEWREQHLKEKLIHMVILAAKHGVSFLQVWADGVEEKIKTEVYDAFDIYLDGSMNSIYDCPMIIKTTKKTIDELQANEQFDEDKTAMLTPDNKYASSEIKDAYMKSKFGTGDGNSVAPSVILKEAFIKEYVNEENKEFIPKDILKEKAKGDIVVRHAFSAGGVVILDEYLDVPDYPFVDFRFEPGAIYQTPYIERFIPANKSLDIAMSRIEKWLNTMVTGTWLTRKGEDFTITNVPGGQKLEYTAQPPVQGAIQPLPNTVFNYIQLLNQNIEEQGASTSALNQLPDGVKSGKAIESVKATEFANLKIPSDQLKESVRNISERMLDITSRFIYPKNVMLLEEGEPQYFDIIGERGMKKRQEMDIKTQTDYVPIKSDYRVDINVESGLGFTEQGKRETALQIAEFMRGLAQEGYVNQEGVKLFVKQLLDTFAYGNTAEFMQVMDEVQEQPQMTEDQIAQMKVAVLEVMKDAGLVGPDAEQQQVDTTKAGVAEVIKDLG